MKKIMLSILLIAFVSTNAKSQGIMVQNNPVGKWKFETPYT